MTRDEIRQAILDALATVAPEGDFGRLKADRPLRDQLDIDSYDFLNVVVALLSGFLLLQLSRISTSPSDVVVLDSPLAGEWFVTGAGNSVLVNGHSPNEIHAVDFRKLGPNGLTHTAGGMARLEDFDGFGTPVLAPADGRIVEVIDSNADTPAGINGDQANLVMLDIGDGRFVVLVHLQQGSAIVRVGDEVRSGDPLAAVGNSGHTNEPHLHLQVQDSRAISNADRTYPIAFRNVQITRGGPWPWSDERILRTGDTIRGLAEEPLEVDSAFDLARPRERFAAALVATTPKDPS